MTDLSRKVAETIGWRKVPWGRNSTVWERPTETTREPSGTEPLTEAQYECPDYAHDLNLAMEFVRSIPKFWRLAIDADDEIRLWVDGRGYSERDKDLAAAICKAGLRALGEE